MFLCFEELLLLFSRIIGLFHRDIPNVSNDVTPSVTRAGIASGFIQNEIHDMTTINADGMYV